MLIRAMSFNRASEGGREGGREGGTYLRMWASESASSWLKAFGSGDCDVSATRSWGTFVLESLGCVVESLGPRHSGSRVHCRLQIRKLEFHTMFRLQNGSTEQSRYWVP